MVVRGRSLPALEDEEPNGPPIVVRQMQLHLEGIEPLSDEQRVEAWFQEQEHDTADTRTAALFLRDQRTRRARAARWGQVQELQAPFASSWGWLFPGGSEGLWLYHEAERAYVEGFPLAALLCAHAASERVLAGCLQGYEDELDKRWRLWGLGPLVKEAFQRGLIDEPLRDKLMEVNEVRKVSAHFKPPLEPNSLHVRAIRRADAKPELGDEDALDEIAEADALLAIGAATELMRGEQGFWRARWG